MDLLTIITEYPNLKYYFESIFNTSPHSISFENDCIKIYVEQVEAHIKIHTSQLRRINNFELADNIPNFKYLSSYGIKFQHYHEIALTISHKNFVFWCDDTEWPIEPLVFEIGKDKFEIGPISDLMVLLNENCYLDEDGDHANFYRFASIKMILSENSDYKKAFQKALFYLNSYYLKPIKFIASLQNLEASAINNPLSVYLGENQDGNIKDSLSKAIHERTKEIKVDLKKIEPISLYNKSLLEKGEQRFLLLYRILEFFFHSSILNTINKIRFDKEITSEELLKMISSRNESTQLENLLKDTLEEKIKNKIVRFALDKEIITSDKFSLFSRDLYKFRNALVNAKEKEVETTKFPNPFEIDKKTNYWVTIVEEIALIAIKKYNV